MHADHNLEPFGLADIAEMVAGVPTSDVRIVVQMDRTSGYTTQPLPGLGDFTDTRRFEVTTAGSVPVGPFLGEKNSDDPGVLADFLAWGLQNYPSRRVALVMWDHGGAWTGFGHDVDSGGQGMSLDGIEEGISLGLSIAGKDRLDLLGFDACLMANLEVASQLQATADILLASEELEPGPGWDYSAFVRELRLDPELSAVEFGERVVDSYFASAPDEGQRSTMTLSVVDLSHVGALVAAVGAVAGRLDQSLIARSPWLSAARAVARSQSYEMHVRDLGGVANWLASTTPDAALKPLLVTLETEYQRAVVYQLGGSARAGSTGLTTYLPMHSAAYQATAPRYATSGEFARTSAWRTFLARYHLEGAKDIQSPIVGALTLSRSGGGLRVQSSILADDLQSALLGIYLLQSDGSRVFIGAWPTRVASGGAVDMTYPMTVVVLEHAGDAVAVTPVYDYDGWQVATASSTDSFDRYTGAIPVEFSDDGVSWQSGRLAFSAHTPTGVHSLTGIVTENASGIANIGLPAGVRIRPMALVTGPSGQTIEALGEIVLTTPSSARLLSAPLRVNTRVVPVIKATDLVGNTGSSTTASVRVLGTPCVSHLSCAATEYCDAVDRDCRPVYGATFRISEISANLGPVDQNGAEWDAFGGLPDPFAALYQGATVLGSTPVVADSFTASWNYSLSITFSQSETFAIHVWDSDLSDPDHAGGVQWVNPVTLVRDGRGSFAAGSGALRSLNFVVTPE